MNKTQFYAGSLFPDFQANKKFYLANRRYLGNKSKLADWILGVILAEAHDARSFLDLFAGTGAVGNKALNCYEKVIFNDFLYCNYVSFIAFFADGVWDEAHVAHFIRQMNAADVSALGDNYFSRYFGNKYFGMEAAIMIGHIREEIEKRKHEFTLKEYCVLIASLIYSADKIANTTGQYEAYRKTGNGYKDFEMCMIDAQRRKGVQIYNEDANLLVRSVSSDIVYLDPPYNSRQYCSLYHVIENLAKWDKPALYRDTSKPLRFDNKSEYSTKNACSAFSDLISMVDAKYIAVSYNNTYGAKSDTSNNKMTLGEIRQILERRGITKVYEKDYKPFNAGKTDLRNHKEYLFITKVKK